MIVTLQNRGACVTFTPVAISASAEQVGNEAPQAIDGNTQTRWSAEGTQHLVLDMGEAVWVAEVHIAWHQGETRKTTFSLEASLNGTEWNSGMQRESSGNATTFEVYPLPEAIRARYVRITGTGNNANAWNSVSEVVVRGFARPAPG
jgi:hypothetical protein